MVTPGVLRAQKLAFHGQPPPGARREILRSQHLATCAGEVVGHEKQVFAVVRGTPGGAMKSESKLRGDDLEYFLP